MVIRIATQSARACHWQPALTASAAFALRRMRANISAVLAGQRVGIEKVDANIWIVRFMRDERLQVDLERKALQPLDNPFGARVSPMS